MEVKQISEALRVIRYRLGMTQEDMAELTGLTYPAVNDMELGQRAPISIVTAYAKALGVSVSALMVFIEEMNSGDYLLPPLEIDKIKLKTILAKRKKVAVPRIRHSTSVYKQAKESSAR